MNQITKRYGLLAVLLGVAMLAGCDPYPSENTDSARVTGASAIDTAFTGGIAPVQGTQAADGSWTVSGVSLAAFNGNDPDSAVGLVIQLNQLLGDNAALIEPTPGNCSPVNPAVLTIAPAAPATSPWYACYYPSQGSPSQGPSIIVFQSTDPDDPLAAALLPVGTTTVTGNIPTVRGTAAVNVSAVVTP